MNFAEIVVSDQQALMARLALDTMLADPEQYVMEDDERAEFERLSVFLGQVATRPESFPVTGKNAARIRSIVRRANGHTDNPNAGNTGASVRNSRKKRQERRQGAAKRLRKGRREFAAQYNLARQLMEDEMRQAEEDQRLLEERIATQPKFSIKNANGQVVLSDIPAEAILNEQGEPAFPQIIIAGT